MIDPVPLASGVEIILGHNSLAVFYEAMTPTLTINGRKERRPWGAHWFNLPPGDYEIAASYPWIISECGRNSVRFSLAAGERKKVTYCARFIRFVPGSMKVESVVDAAAPIG